MARLRIENLGDLLYRYLGTTTDTRALARRIDDMVGPEGEGRDGLSDEYVTSAEVDAWIGLGGTLKTTEEAALDAVLKAVFDAIDHPTEHALGAPPLDMTVLDRPGPLSVPDCVARIDAQIEWLRQRAAAASGYDKAQAIEKLNAAIEARPRLVALVELVASTPPGVSGALSVEDLAASYAGMSKQQRADARALERLLFIPLPHATASELSPLPNLPPGLTVNAHYTAYSQRSTVNPENMTRLLSMSSVQISAPAGTKLAVLDAQGRVVSSWTAEAGEGKWVDTRGGQLSLVYLDEAGTPHALAVDAQSVGAAAPYFLLN